MDPASRGGPERKPSEEGRTPSPTEPIPLLHPTLSTEDTLATAGFAALFFGDRSGGESPGLDAGAGDESGGETAAPEALDSFPFASWLFDERWHGVGEVAAGGRTGGEAKEASDNSGSPARAAARTMPRAPGPPPRPRGTGMTAGGGDAKAASDNSGSPARAPTRTTTAPGTPPRSHRSTRGAALGAVLRASGTPTALGASGTPTIAAAKTKRRKGCPHGKRKARCIECGGSQVCTHGMPIDKRRRPCAQCAGAGPQKVKTPTWIAEERRLFAGAVATFGRGHWEQIADAVGTRTAEQCRTHYVRAPSWYISLSALLTFHSPSSPPFILSHSLSPPLRTLSPPQQKVNPGASTATHDTTRGVRRCRRCRLHGVLIAITGHQCPLAKCRCAACIKLAAALAADARATALRKGKKRKGGSG
jgi:hypothetical protein